jgi:hypothetical protein
VQAFTKVKVQVSNILITGEYMPIINVIKLSLIQGSVITLIHQWSALFAPIAVDWLAILLSYGVSLLSVYWLTKSAIKTNASQQSEQGIGQLNPQHLEDLYKQASLVERNAHKANRVFNHQLQYIKKLLAKTKELEHGVDYDVAHAGLVKELALLEQHVQRIVTEMSKNVKLGEKLQQSIANIDPEIGVL